METHRHRRFNVTRPALLDNTGILEECFIPGSYVVDGFNNIRVNNNEVNTANAAGIHSVSIGAHSQATGDYSVAIGTPNCTASGYQTVSVGSSSTSSGDAAVCVGDDNIAVGSSAVAMGKSCTASGDSAVAIGTSALASGSKAVAIGGNSATSGSNTAVAAADRSVAIGQLARVSDVSAVGGICIGEGQVTAEKGINIGFGFARAVNSISIGPNARCDTNAEGSIAIGTNAIINVKNSVSIGQTSSAADNCVMLPGVNVDATGFYAQSGIFMNRTVTTTTTTTRDLNTAEFSPEGMIVRTDAGSSTLTTPSVAAMIAAYALIENEMAFRFYINVGSAAGAVTLAPGTGWTIVGNAVVATNTAATFLVRFTSTTTETGEIYRI
jgi:hypothetical protein